MANFKYIEGVAIFILLGIFVIGAASEKGRKNQHPKTAGNDDEKWTISVETLDNREVYLDPWTGEPKGHWIDIIKAVCSVADKDCCVVYDRFSNCWDSVDGMQVGGFGLFNFYYDGCIGWVHTTNRARTFQFTDSFNQNRHSFFVVKPSNPDNFDPFDVSGKRIGFVSGFFSSPLCLAQNQDLINGGVLPNADIELYGDVDSLFQGVANGEVAAGFLGAIVDSDLVEYMDADKSVFCAVDGLGVMTRKDNGLADWWNPAWQNVLNSDVYQKICSDLVDVHGELPGPNPKDKDYCIQV